MEGLSLEKVEETESPSAITMETVSESETAVTVSLMRDEVVEMDGEKFQEGKGKAAVDVNAETQPRQQRHVCAECHFWTESRSTLLKHMFQEHSLADQAEESDPSSSADRPSQDAPRIKRKKPAKRNSGKRQNRSNDELDEGLTTVETAIPGIKKLIRKPYYNCCLCTAAFLKPVDMEHHLKFSHTQAVEEEMKKLGVDVIGDGKDSVCRYCSKVFYDKNNLVRHSLEVHTKFRSHVCQLCPGRRGFHKPEFGYDHVRRFHYEEMTESGLCPKEFIEETIKYVPRPYAMTIAVTPVPSHMYFLA